MNTKKVALLILDGWGIGNKSQSDAVYHAKTPVMDKLMLQYPNASLNTTGLAVGLPDGQMGNSEVGHLNIGAGRVVFQELVRINKACEDGELANNKILLDAIAYAKNNHKKLHFMGLVSDGCIHSSDMHLHTLCRIAKTHDINNFMVHAFTDGRDTDPKSGAGFVGKLIDVLKETGGQLASITGRYYAMDRDKRWERVKVAYDAMVHGVGEKTNDLLDALKKRYEIGETDEFIQPIIHASINGKIEAGDVVISFNYRTDRCREITQALTQQDFPEHSMKTLPLYYVTMTEYDSNFRDVKVIFEKDNLDNTLGEVLSKHGKTQLRIAETEKYPHVTFFFSGGREETFEGESRIMIPSPKVATYDLQPEMSAYGITDAVVASIQNDKPDFICLNFANPDMVGHTGVYEAIIKAVETVDECLGIVVEAALRENYSILVIADHGNADFALNEDGSPNTAHSTNPVPFILIDQDVSALHSGKLADVAPTILHIMDIPRPDVMNGNILIA
ncbi:MAG: 2,3-bisphosphoglycerate-independent phosphoglycerate mutase [Flavobacteriales bacterium]